MVSRRQMIGLGAVAGLYTGYRLSAPYVSDLIAGDFDFAPVPGLQGFRMIARGDVTAALADPFFGIAPEGGTRIPSETARANLESWLYETQPKGVVPIASFSDYNCPYCRLLSDRLLELTDVAVTWHELPLLGPASVVGARAALAARYQDGYLPMHKRFMRAGFRITTDYVAAVASEVGLDVETLLVDMSQDEVSTTLARSKAISELFGIIGTPALVIGRTLVIGQISQRRMARLIALERQGRR